MFLILRRKAVKMHCKLRGQRMLGQYLLLSAYSCRAPLNRFTLFSRSISGRKHHKSWEPQLEPPPVLANFRVVIVGTKKAPSVGTVARAMGAFECLNLFCAAPRVNIYCRPSLNPSKGSQHIIHGATVCSSLEEALEGTTFSVAFARWISGNGQTMIHGLPELCELVGVQAALKPEANGGAGGPDAGKPCVALVFGREYEGLSEDEINQCSVSCSIKMGRLQESLSISHAVCLVLAHMFEQRMRYMPSEQEMFKSTIFSDDH